MSDLYHFGADHYVPILRSKQGELDALMHLQQRDRSYITPLIEIIPSIFRAKRALKGKEQQPDPDPRDVLRRLAKRLLRSWHYRPFFIDAQHLDGKITVPGSCSSPLGYFAQLAYDWRMSLVPVTGITRAPAFQRVIRELAGRHKNGVCIRVTPKQVMDASFVSHLNSLMDSLQVVCASTDLVIDYGVLTKEDVDLASLLTAVPQIRKWRTLTVASGAFPQDLQDYRPGAQRLTRADWVQWKQYALKKTHGRKPSFSDYTVQFGEYVEPPDNCNPSASLRYALSEEWLIMRGEALKSKRKEHGPGSAQWIAHAIILRDGGHFYGERFSEGDDYIYRMSKKKSGKNGNPMTWIRAGINHHLTVVARQVSELFADASSGGRADEARGRALARGA